MKKTALTFAAAAAIASAAFAQEDGKNIYDVKFESLPADVTALPAERPGDWNFNFRPYGSSDMLWTDPILQRDVTSGAATGDKPTTALNVTCDADGFTVLVLCVEPALAASYANTNGFPSPSIEFFFTPGDADTPKIEHYYQMIYQNDKLNEFPWLVENRGFRPVLPYASCREYVMDKAILVKLSFSWEPLYDRLPIFCAKRDNFWRLSLIRWGALSQTWGGTVHQASQAGYLRWPAFTDAQRSAIMKGVLKKAWVSFCQASGEVGTKTNKGWNGVEPLKAHFRADEDKADPRSYVSYNEDPGFRPVLEEITAECQGFAPGIGTFEQLTPAEQEKFYKAATDKLFNFRYDVEAAYAKYVRDQLFK